MKSIIYNLLPTKKTNTKLDDKKKVNTPWNSKLFFQIGLIISLLFAYWVIESTSQLQTEITIVSNDDYLTEPSLIQYVIEEPEHKIEKKITKKTKKNHRQKLVVTSILPVANTFNKKEAQLASTETNQNNKIDKPITGISTKKNKETKNILSVEYAPVFPGCESAETNTERINCFSEKVRKFISRKFNADRNSGNLKGKQRIPIVFTVDKNGLISNISVRTNDKGLQKEAKRVLGKLPKMTPGKQGNTPVKVQYTLPLVVVLEQ